LFLYIYIHICIHPLETIILAYRLRIIPNYLDRPTSDVISVAVWTSINNFRKYFENSAAVAKPSHQVSSKDGKGFCVDGWDQPAVLRARYACKSFAVRYVSLSEYTGARDTRSTNFAGSYLQGTYQSFRMLP